MPGGSFPSLLALVAALLLGGCEPDFVPTGTVTVDGVSFLPDDCRVLTCPTGIELRETGGGRLRLGLPPQRLDAFREISGRPTVSYFTRAGGPAREFGTCGSLTLTGEGYHGGGRRAASGRVTLDCSGPPRVTGSLSFTGCF